MRGRSAETPKACIPDLGACLNFWASSAACLSAHQFRPSPLDTENPYVIAKGDDHGFDETAGLVEKRFGQQPHVIEQAEVLGAMQIKGRHRSKLRNLWLPLRSHRSC